MRISDWSSDVCSSDLAALADKKRFGDAWAHKSPEQQWAIIDRLLEEENPDTLHAFLTGDCGLDDEHAKAAARAPLPDGYGRLGETATDRKSGVSGKSEAVSVDIGGSRIITTQNKYTTTPMNTLRQGHK